MQLLLVAVTVTGLQPLWGKKVGVFGITLTVANKVLSALLPQPLLAVTETVPPELPTVVVIEFEVELPDQPDGKVHV